MANLKAQYPVLTRPTEGIIMIDAAGKIIQLNPAAAALFHYDITELLGQSIQVLIPAGNLLSIDKKEISPGCWFARKKEGAEFPAHLAISYQQPGQRLAFISVMDVSGLINSHLRQIASPKSIHE